MMIVILASILFLCFKTEYPAFVIIDNIALGIFILDYALRLFTAGFIKEMDHQNKHKEEAEPKPQDTETEPRQEE